MAIPQDVRKVGAHSNQETRPCDSSSPRPTVAPDSQPPLTGRKRKHRPFSSRNQGIQTNSLDHPASQAKRHKSLTGSCPTSSSSTKASQSSWDRAERHYWDSLSRLWLAPDALRELDRRNAPLRTITPPTADISAYLKRCPKDIIHFARHGGPDLSGIRNYPNPEEDSSTTTKMSSGREKRSSAYSPAFAQHLTDNYVLPPDIDQRPANYQEWKEVLVQPRASLSPSCSSEGSYKSFVRAVGNAENEDAVMSRVFPKIRAKKGPPSGQNVQFGHITELAPKMVVAKPDYYEGNRPGPGNRNLRERLDKSIVPSSRKELPFLPNFFVEAKGPDGTIAVAERQVRHDGALGARAMHSVQSLGRREKYKAKAHTASAILHGKGHLDMFTHHMTQPRGHGTPVHTHMTPIGSWSLTNSPQTLREGRTALRNTSEKAQQHREHAIQGAHHRLGISTPEGSEIAPRSLRRRPTRLTRIVESSGSDSESSSEAVSSDDANYKQSSGLRPKGKGKLLNPKVVSAAPKTLARRSPSPKPRTRRGKPIVPSDSDAGSLSEEETPTIPRRRQLSSAKSVTATPKRLARRDPCPPRRELRPRRGSRRA